MNDNSVRAPNDSAWIIAVSVFNFWQFCNQHTVRPVLRCHLWDKEKVVYYKTCDLLKGFNSYEIFYDRTRQSWLLNTSECLILEVTAWEDLTISYSQVLVDRTHHPPFLHPTPPFFILFLFYFLFPWLRNM